MSEPSFSPPPSDRGVVTRCDCKTIDDSDIARMRGWDKIAPGPNFGRDIIGLGASRKAAARAVKFGKVRVRGVHVSNRALFSGGDKEQETTSRSEGDAVSSDDDNVRTCCGKKRPRATVNTVTHLEAEVTTEGDSSLSPPQPTTYFRLRFSDDLEVCLPLELMRKEHPQVLIDYLLSTAHWS